MFGIYDYYRVTKEEKVLSLFNEAIETLKKILPEYDPGYWSKYSLYEKRDLTHFVSALASVHYHRTHISQLRVLYAITGEKIFKDYADKWDKGKINLLINFCILFILNCCFVPNVCYIKLIMPLKLL